MQPSLRAWRTGPLRAVAPDGKPEPASSHLGSTFDLVCTVFTESVSIQPNRALVREGDRADTVFLVQSGILRSGKVLSDGRRQIVNFHEKGDLIGLLEGEVHAYSVEGVTLVRLKPANRIRLHAFLNGRPQLCASVLSLATRELAAVRSRAVMLGRQCAEERVCSFLLHRARGVRVVELQMSRRDMADYLGLTVETVSRILTQMESAGLIRRINAYRIDIPDSDRLSELSGR